MGCVHEDLDVSERHDFPLLTGLWYLKMYFRGHALRMFSSSAIAEKKCSWF